MTTLDLIRNKIVELIPEIKGRPHINVGTRGGFRISTMSYDCPITLADVLRAIDSDRETSCFVGLNFHSDGAYLYYEDMENGFSVRWDLTKSYDDQSEAVKLFVGKILGIV